MVVGGWYKTRVQTKAGVHQECFKDSSHRRRKVRTTDGRWVALIEAFGFGVGSLRCRFCLLVIYDYFIMILLL